MYDEIYCSADKQVKRNKWIAVFRRMGVAITASHPFLTCSPAIYRASSVAFNLGLCLTIITAPHPFLTCKKERPIVCHFVFSNRHWFNRVPGAHLRIACLPFT
jgi:hypothetical protein